MKLSKDLVAASSIPLILSILKNGDDYGYSIIKKVSLLSNGEINWKEGSLYPVLKKMEMNDLIKSYISDESGRNRKYYSIETPGVTRLVELKDEWNFLTQTMFNLWNPTT